MAESEGVAQPGPTLGARVRAYLDTTYGAVLLERAQRRPERWGFAAMAVLGAAVYLLSMAAKPTSQDYFSRLADAFLHGRYWLEQAPSWLAELIPIGEGRWVVAYPPMPAVLAMPFVAVFGRPFPAQIYSSLYAGLAVGVVYLVFGRLGILARIRDRLALTVIFAFGTCFWFISIGGTAWYFAHVTAVLFLGLALLAALTKRPAWVAGLLLGLAALARLPVGLALPFVMAAQLGFPGIAALRIATLRQGSWRPLVRTVVIFGLGLVGPAILYFAYNQLRYGTIVDMSYVRIPNVLDDPIYAKHGILSVWYIPRNLFAMLFRSWNFVENPPFLKPSWWGLSLFFTTPIYLWLVRARVRTPMVAWAVLAIALVSIPIVTHGNVGMTQFGYRFSLDFQLPLFVILATVVAEGWTKRMAAAGAASVVICAYANWAISIGFVSF